MATLRKIVRTILRSVVRWSGKPAGADSGTYPIRKSRQSDGDATVTFSDYQFEEAEGELMLERDGDYFRGNYSVTTLGGDNIEVQGSFDHVILGDS